MEDIQLSQPERFLFPTSTSLLDSAKIQPSISEAMTPSIEKRTVQSLELSQVDSGIAIGTVSFFRGILAESCAVGSEKRVPYLVLLDSVRIFTSST